MGLYFNFSIVLFYIPIIAVYIIIKNIYLKIQSEIPVKRLKLLSIKRYLRYLKLVINLKVVLTIIFFSIISNSIVLFQNSKYDKLYYNEQDLKGEAIVLSNKMEKEYYYIYKIKILHLNNSNKYNNSYLYLKVNKKSTNLLQYGDKIGFTGQFIEPSCRRNYGGFDYKSYLKTLKIYGNVKADKIQVLEKEKGNTILQISNKISLKIKEKINSLMKEESSSIISGILLGDKSEIEEEIQERFKISNISHILAVSGMHVSYIILGIDLLLKSSMGKRKTKFITIILLIMYMLITGLSPSVVRASVMGIIVTGAGIIHRKNDIWTSIAISLFLILVYNPFLISNIGLQFSYLGTIGIIVFHKNVLKALKSIKIKNRKWKYRFNRKVILISNKIKEILAVTISAQLAIFPLMIYHFNLFGTYFLLSNLLISVIIGPIIILSVFIVILSFIFYPLAIISSFILELLIQILITISNVSELPFSKIYFPTLNITTIILYYIFIIIFNYIYTLYNSKKLTNTQIRMRNLIALLKYKIIINKKKYVKVVLVCILLLVVYTYIPKKLNIYFVDVGQGDSTFIVTPRNKTILIDGGGSSSTEYDVGESTLLPYILDRGYTKIDYIFISHFDQDHVGGILTILQELKVGRVIISKQGEDSENYQKFLKIVKENKIEVAIVKKGNRIKIENDLYFDILWPEDELIKENILNNNSTVMKMCYKDFSILFTGDIEEIAEKKILETYKGKEKQLATDILKVAHHGSKTSTIEEFLNVIKPNMALIGVGKDNNFGHPSEVIINRLIDFGTKIYRTDTDGEISIVVDKKGRIKLKKFIE